MILPQKHLHISESILGLGGVVLDCLKDEAKTVDEIWQKFQIFNNSEHFRTKWSFDDMLLALSFLYSVGAVAKDQNDQIFYATN